MDELGVKFLKVFLTLPFLSQSYHILAYPHTPRPLGCVYSCIRHASGSKRTRFWEEGRSSLSHDFSLSFATRRTPCALIGGLQILCERQC